MVLEISFHSTLTSWEFCSQREMDNKPDWVKPEEVSPVSPVLWSIALVLLLLGTHTWQRARVTEE